MLFTILFGFALTGRFQTDQIFGQFADPCAKADLRLFVRVDLRLHHLQGFLFRVQFLRGGFRLTTKFILRGSGRKGVDLLIQVEDLTFQIGDHLLLDLDVFGRDLHRIVHFFATLDEGINHSFHFLHRLIDGLVQKVVVDRRFKFQCAVVRIHHII